MGSSASVHFLFSFEITITSFKYMEVFFSIIKPFIRPAGKELMREMDIWKKCNWKKASYEKL